MSIQIIGMEMPKEPDEMIEIAIFGDGKVIQTGESWRNLESGKCYYTPTTPEKFFNAVPVPPHGDLIDRGTFLAEKRHLYCKNCERRKGMKNGKMKFVYDIGDAPCRACGYGDVLDDIEDAPTIIESEGE